MNVLSLFSFAVFAAETILSPLPDDGILIPTPTPKPDVSFGQLVSFVPEGFVLGETTESEATPASTPTPTPTPQPRRTNKSHYTIAVLGDSMVDTLGPDVPHLRDTLKNTFPLTSFTILNYGVGATNIDYGIERITSGYTYLSNSLPSLISQNPDVVVIESFGYNPYSYDEGALDRHWLALSRAVDTVKASLPLAKIVIAATIAPNSATFGDGAPGVSFGPQDKVQRTTVIKKYLKNAVRFAQSQGLPLADAFHPSLDANGDGKLAYINPGDHIHYSDAGRALFASAVTNAIVANKLLE